jgi:endonuclease/exonuclease/phosphatase (EEP) superfamily protein YafD
MHRGAKVGHENRASLPERDNARKPRSLTAITVRLTRRVPDGIYLYSHRTSRNIFTPAPMSETRPEERMTHKPAGDDPLSPVKLASRVAEQADDEASIRDGQLPMRDRIDAVSRRTGWSRWAIAGAWCVTLALLLVALLRVACHDAAVPLVWLNAFTLYIYLPAYGVLVIAAWHRRWWLAAASAAVVACHLVWVGPDFRPATPYVPPSIGEVESAQTLRIFYANVRGPNREFDAMIDEAIRSNADVIVLAELQRPWFQTLAKSEALKPYPHGTQLKRRHSGDINVFSRLPVRRFQVITSQDRTCVLVDVALGNDSLRLFCLHSPRPLVDGENQYYSFWQEIEPILAKQPEPLVVIGDFNATQHSLVYEQLTTGRLRSAHEDRGRGYATTWPNGLKPLPPIRIDQALLSPQVECVSVVEGRGLGSDHKPVILDLRVHSSAAAGTATR